jgi:hypothetical protein
MLAVMATLLVSGPAAFGGEPVSFFGLSFPEQIQGAPRGETRDFETTKPGLGYSTVYPHDDWTANVYVYDLGRGAISESLSSPEITEQFNQATGDIVVVGLYRDIVVGPRFIIRDRSGAHRFICGTFTFTHPEAGPARSALCLTSWRNKLVKIRLTASDPSDVRSLMQAFAGAWMRILWPIS